MGMAGGKERRREGEELGRGREEGGEGRRGEGICRTNVKLLATRL